MEGGEGPQSAVPAYPPPLGKGKGLQSRVPTYRAVRRLLDMGDIRGDLARLGEGHRTKKQAKSEKKLPLGLGKRDVYFVPFLSIG